MQSPRGTGRTAGGREGASHPLHRRPAEDGRTVRGSAGIKQTIVSETAVVPGSHQASHERQPSRSVIRPRGAQPPAPGWEPE